MPLSEILLIEPFYGGSHKILMDLIKAELEKERPHSEVCLVTMTAKKWHWRARTSSLYLSEAIPKEHGFRVLLTSSVMNLAELIALRPDLAGCKKIVYFHENQLVYPVQHKKERDFQYGYNEVLTCLVADLVIFNSHYNYHSFLNNLKTHFRLQPDYRPKDLKEKIVSKSEVLYFPVPVESVPLTKNYNEPLHIVWPHRWEHDKGIDEFIYILLRLTKKDIKFKISLLGEQPSNIGDKYESARLELNDHVVHWGYLEKKSDYLTVLGEAHVAVSTAKHEFFGVSMMECVMAGCYPLCPNSLVYPELYSDKCLYNSLEHLFDIIVNFSTNMDLLQEQTLALNTDWSCYSADSLIPKYMNYILT